MIYRMFIEYVRRKHSLNERQLFIFKTPGIDSLLTSIFTLFIQNILSGDCLVCTILEYSKRYNYVTLRRNSQSD